MDDDRIVALFAQVMAKLERIDDQLTSVREDMTVTMDAIADVEDLKKRLPG